MNAPMSRRQFFRICAAGMGSSSVVGLGLSPGAALAEVRAFSEVPIPPEQVQLSGVYVDRIFVAGDAT